MKKGPFLLLRVLDRALLTLGKGIVGGAKLFLIVTASLGTALLVFEIALRIVSPANPFNARLRLYPKINREIETKDIKGLFPIARFTTNSGACAALAATF